MAKPSSEASKTQPVVIDCDGDCACTSIHTHMQHARPVLNANHRPTGFSIK